MRGIKPKPLLNNDPVDLRPPGWLTRRQKLLWRRAFDSAPAGLLTAMDAGLLTNWVIACDTHREACEKMRGTGLIVKTRIVEVVKTKKDGSSTREQKGGQPVQNPYLPIINRQAEIMIRAAGDLGFTPVGRARMTKSVGAPARKVLTDEPQGKKAQANAEAIVAQKGTSWEDILPTGPAQ